MSISSAKNFEFKINSQWAGYNSSFDKTNLAENIYVGGSQNVYKKLNGNIANRPGLKRIGSADSTFAKVDSAFIWNTSWGATFPIWVTNETLQVSVDNVWYTLLSGLTKTRYVFDKWWDSSLAHDVCLFVKGDDDMQMWGGGFALISSTTVNTIVLDRTVVASVLTSSGSVVVNGTTYTYSGSSGSTLTGVSPDPTGEADGSGVLQAVTTSTNTPASGFLSDFIKVINNQVYVGSYLSRLCYISANDDYTDYVVPSPTVSGSPDLLTLDSTLNGIGVKNGNAWISFGTSEWAEISFQEITVGSTLTRKTNVKVAPVAKLAAAYAHEFIDNDGNNIVYLSKDQQLRTIGDFNNSFVNAYPSLSQQVATELSEENFSGGGLACIGEFTYITAPVSGKVYLYQVRQAVDGNNQVVVERLWHSPFIWNATRVDEIDGVTVVFSNSNPQVYQAWDTDQYYDDSPSDEELPYTSTLAFSYRDLNRRQGLLSFDKVFTEGYITQGTELDLTVNYNYQGATESVEVPVNSADRPATLFISSVGSLGDDSLGDTPLGDELDDDMSSDFPKFKNINSLALINCFEYQLIYSSSEANSHWELLAMGTNATVEPDQNATFLINKL